MCSWPTFSAFSHSASSSQVCVHLHCTLYTVHCTLYKLFNCITLSLSGEIQIRGLTLMLVFFDRVDADPVLKHQVLSRPHHGLLLPLPQPHHRVHKVSGRCLQQYWPVIIIEYICTKDPWRWHCLWKILFFRILDCYMALISTFFQDPWLLHCHCFPILPSTLGHPRKLPRWESSWSPSSSLLSSGLHKSWYPTIRDMST